MMKVVFPTQIVATVTYIDWLCDALAGLQQPGNAYQRCRNYV